MVKVSASSASTRATSGSTAGKSQPASPSQVNGVSVSPFAAVMKDTTIKAFNGSMEELIALVKAKGEYFLRNPDEDSLNTYKNSIRQYLDKFKKDFISLKEEFGVKRNGEQKVYQLLDTIESDIASVTKETLSDNKATELLASLDDIRGLVIDILG